MDSLALPLTAASRLPGYHRGASPRRTDRSPSLVGDGDSGLSRLTENHVPEPMDHDEKAARRSEEAALLSRIVERDEGAVEELYARYSGPLYSLAYQVTRADRFAQEVVQEVFVAVWNQAGRFDPARGAVGSWLFSLARHKAIDLVRRESTVRRRTIESDLEFETAPDDVDHEAWLNVRRERVRAAVETLGETQRVALELAFFAGLTHVEVAERLGIPLGTAKTRIRSGLLKLRDTLGDSLSEDEPAAPLAGDARWTTGRSTN